MNRQLVIISTLAAALLCSPVALAKNDSDHDGGQNGKQHDEDHDGGNHWKDGDKDHHGSKHGDHDNKWKGHARGHRHYWHGRWWDYGVGPCWLRTPVGWIWTCGDYDYDY